MKRTFTIEDIRSWSPCYDPLRHLPEGWSGTAIDILNTETIPFKDRLWVVIRNEFISEKTMRLFAVWCARQVQHLMTDPRSVRAIDIAEQFAFGNATREQLHAAWAAALDAARAAASDAACGAAREAAWDAARVTAREAAWGAAREAAWDAASAAAQASQKNKLVEMIEAEWREQDGSSN